MSRIGVPSIISEPERRTWPVFSSTDSILQRDRPIAFGLCGVLVANRPTLSPPRRGGATLVFTWALRVLFSWKMKIIQRCEKAERPWVEKDGLFNCLHLLISSSSGADGVRLGCRGVPDFVLKTDFAKHIG